MPISIKGTGGGGVTLDAGAAASSTTLTLPNTSGTILQSGTAVTAAQGGTGLTSPGTSGNVLTSNGSAWTSAAPAGGGLPTATAIGQIPFSTDGSTYTATQKIVQGTAVASTSGTSISFTSIPSWVKRITVMLTGFKSSGSSNYLIQIGSGSFTTSGYQSASSAVVGSAASASSTAGFIFLNNGYGTASTIYGSITLNNLGSNTWTSSGVLNWSNVAGTIPNSGAVALSGVLDRIQLTTVNGTDTFAAGTVNILWE